MNASVTLSQWTGLSPSATWSHVAAIRAELGLSIHYIDLSEVFGAAVGNQIALLRKYIADARATTAALATSVETSAADGHKRSSTVSTNSPSIFSS
jgi:hypothetical protein